MAGTRPPRGCEGCVHASRAGGCDYLLHTGHSRGCPPGEACAVKDTGQRPRRTCQLPPRRSDWDEYRRTAATYALERDETALRLYAAGASDPEIARATGWGVTSVRSWRRQTGRAANTKRKKEEHGDKNHEPGGGAGR